MNNITKTQSILDRWLPRLGDKSIDVQEKSIERLSQVATDDPSCRAQVIPALMRAAEAPGDSWANRIPLSVLQGTEEIPRRDKAWLAPFLDFYLRLAETKQVMEEDALNLVTRILEDDSPDPNDKTIQAIVAFARMRLAQNDDSDARGAMFLISDWHSDHTNG